jgi:hypothetical protein
LGEEKTEVKPNGGEPQMKNENILVYKSFVEKTFSKKNLQYIINNLINSSHCPFANLNIKGIEDHPFDISYKKYCNYSGYIYVNPSQTTYKRICLSNKQWLFCPAIRFEIISIIKGFYKPEIEPNVFENEILNKFWLNEEFLKEIKDLIEEEKEWRLFSKRMERIKRKKEEDLLSKFKNNEISLEEYKNEFEKLIEEMDRELKEKEHQKHERIREKLEKSKMIKEYFKFLEKEDLKVISNYRKWRNESIKCWEIKNGTLNVRRVNENNYDAFENFALENKGKYRRIHLSKFIKHKIVKKIIELLKSVTGKIIRPTTGEWVHNHLGEHKDFFGIEYLKPNNKTYSMIKDIKVLALNGSSPKDIRTYVMNRYNVRKISVKTIIKLMFISIFHGERVAVLWLRSFIRSLIIERYARIFAWTGKPPPSSIYF